MKLKFLLIISILFLTSCHSVSQEIYNQSSKEDKILYIRHRPGGKLYPDEPINIFKNNTLIATIKLKQDMRTLRIIYSHGNTYDLWKYYDYSGIDKITQSKEEDTIRIYHWESAIAGLFKTKNYVTEFNINLKNKKKFRLKK
jgi:hypothetical protein